MVTLSLGGGLVERIEGSLPILPCGLSESAPTKLLNAAGRDGRILLRMQPPHIRGRAVHQPQLCQPLS